MLHGQLCVGKGLGMSGGPRGLVDTTNNSRQNKLNIPDSYIYYLHSDKLRSYHVLKDMIWRSILCVYVYVAERIL